MLFKIGKPRVEVSCLLNTCTFLDQCREGCASLSNFGGNGPLDRRIQSVVFRLVSCEPIVKVRSLFLKFSDSVAKFSPKSFDLGDFGCRSFNSAVDVSITDIIDVLRIGRCAADRARNRIHMTKKRSAFLNGCQSAEVNLVLCLEEVEASEEVSDFIEAALCALAIRQ